MEKVKVLLSAYNGEKYICRQIDSILAQTYDNIEIHIRDDGSKDNTLGVLKAYEENPKIHIYKGDNVGFVHSFETLMVLAGEADYYAFCDQDDVWLPQKIEYALELLKKEEQELPLLYFSNYDYYDSELNFSEHHQMDHPNISFQNAMVDCVSLGFNSVFNRTARDVVVKNMPKHSLGHDWWMYMVCVSMGKVLYDSRITVKYRRHGTNVSNAGSNFLKTQIWRFKKFFLSGYFKKIKQQILEFKQFYENALSPEDKKMIDLFTTTGFHPVCAMKKVCYPKRFRQNTIDEIFVRVIFLIGRL